MSAYGDNSPPQNGGQQSYPTPDQGQQPYPQPPAGAYGQPAYPAYPAGQGYPVQPFTGPLGKPRSIGVSILLAIVTIGIYTYVWTFKTCKEIKQHSGIGMGGPTFAFAFIPYVGWIVAMVMTASDTGNMVRQATGESRVSGKTTWWVALPLIGNLVWFVKVQGQLNDYWHSLGATD